MAAIWEDEVRKAVEGQLMQVGIETPDALRNAGAKAAWLKFQQIDPSACIHRLLALEGAIRGVRKTMLPDAVKADLKAFYQEHKKCGPEKSDEKRSGRDA
ncbi:MAG: TfoX/Sxy family DNA transformation protein [Faecousia sp.]